MAITLTQAAANHIHHQLMDRQRGIGIRVGIKTTGCSGYAYVLEFADSIEPFDHVFEDKLVKIIIDDKSLIFLDGTEMDFVTEGVNSGIKFTNPNTKGECGCGESFTV